MQWMWFNGQKDISVIVRAVVAIRIPTDGPWGIVPELLFEKKQLPLAAQQ
ncbi:hypothetical protein ACFLX4_00315 [Chloroflexota bacterium]